MEIFFDWCNSLNEQKNEWRGDEHIVSLEFFQKEFSFSSAKITLVSSEKKLQRFAKIAIKQDNKFFVIFSGRLTGFPLGFSGSTVQIEMIAEPDNCHQQLIDFINQNPKQDLHKITNELIKIDDLFYANSNLDNPTVFLEGSNDIFYWNPSNGKLSISNITKGHRCLKISSSQILRNSVKVHLSREPYSEIDVSVTANWIKYQQLTFDIFPMIAQRFNNNFVNSFTDIRATFAKIDNCTYCNIREINPNTAGCLTNYQLKSKDFLIGNKKYSFRRFYYDGNIIFNLNYSQRMVETAHFKIKTNAKNQHVKSIHFDLNELQLPRKFPHWNAYTYYCADDIVLHDENIWKCKVSHRSEKDFDAGNWSKVAKIPDAMPDDSQSSFFETIRGKNALKYAAQKALALLRYSQRYVEIDFCVLLSEFYDISLDDEVVLKNASEYMKEIHGKVIKTQLVASYEKAFIKVTIGCGLTENSAWEQIQNWSPNVKIENENITINDVIRSIEIANPPEQQLEMLGNFRGNSISELRENLRQMSTKIKVILKSQNNVTTVRRDINLPDITVG